MRTLSALGSFAAAALFAAVVTAQPPANGDPVRVSVIGCVQATRSATDSTGTTAIPADETKYVLSNITLVPPDRPGGASPADAVEQSVRMYRLDDAGASMIAPHVGDRVQVTGTLVQRPASPTGTSGRVEPTPGAIVAPTLRVESMQKVSSGSAACLAR